MNSPAYACEHLGELGRQVEIALASVALQRQDFRRRALLCTDNLGTDTDLALVEVDVAPAEAEQLRLPQAGVNGRDDQRSVSRERVLDQRGDLIDVQNPSLRLVLRLRLLGLRKAIDRVVGAITARHREVQNRPRQSQDAARRTRGEVEARGGRQEAGEMLGLDDALGSEVARHATIYTWPAELRPRTRKGTRASLPARG